MLPNPALPPFDYIRPETAFECIRLLQEHGPDCRLMMGGTDLLVRMRDGMVRPRLVVDVKHLPGMQDIHYEPGRGLTVGAAVNLNRLAAHPDVRAHYSLLAQAAESVASYQLRNRATLGGNLANASPAADTAPAVLLLQGVFVLQGPAGAREVPAGAFFRGPGKTVLQPGELVAAIQFPELPLGAVGAYLKLSRTRAGDLALVGVAVLGYPEPTTPSHYLFRIGLGAVAPTPLRAVEAEDQLAILPPGEAVFATAADTAMAAAQPIDDVRAGAEYRKAMVRNLTLRALRAVWKRLDVGC